MPKVKKAPVSILRELKIIKVEIRSLQDENKLSTFSIRALEGKLKDEAALIREQNLEFRDEILGEIKAMRRAHKTANFESRRIL